MFDTVSWPEFLSDFKWSQGQHAIVVKPTGGGKTTLEGQILPIQRGSGCIVVLVTKVFDTTFTKQFPASDGWRRVEEWPPPRHVNRVLLWPRFNDRMSLDEIVAIQKRVFRHALNRIFMERGWTVVFDEEHYMCTELGLAGAVRMFHHQGRSSGLTVVDGIQRPVDVPVISYGSATHAFLGYQSEPDDLRRLANLATRYKRDVAREVETLDFYEFLYVPARVPKGVPLRTTVDLNAKAA